MNGRAWCFAAVAALLALHASPMRAVASGWRIETDNDYYNFWQGPNERPDFGYTHGAEITWEGGVAPRGLARLAPAWMAGTDLKHGPARVQVHVRQAIFAPWSRPPDRPYGGWFGVGLGVFRSTATERHEALVNVGVTGPPSFGERIQRYFHRTFGFQQPFDWEGQIPYEPGIALEGAGAWRGWNGGTDGGLQIHGGPQWRARVGTYVVDARFGLETTLGIHPPAPWGGTSRTSGAGSVYLLAAARLDVIARDVMLDGTLFRYSDGVSATPLVPEWETGIGFRIRRARFEWHVTRRAKDYRIQPVPHTYSSLIFTLEH